MSLRGPVFPGTSPGSLSHSGFALRSGLVALAAMAAFAEGALWNAGFLCACLALVAAVSALGFLAARFQKAAARVLVMLGTAAVLLTGLDLALRGALADSLYNRVHERLLVAPPGALAFARYAPDSSVRMTSYGDLAAMSGDPSLREPREEVFVTDDYGFRNSPEVAALPAYDVVLLGDSFGVGVGTTQAACWG